MVHLYSLDLEVDLSDPERFRIFERCDSLTRLHVGAYDDDLNDFYGDHDEMEHLHLLISILGRSAI